MRVVVLGGTRFIGRAIVEELASSGHDVLIVHRGVLEPADMPAVQHLHAERPELPARRSELSAFEPDAAIDCRALTKVDAQTAIDALPARIRMLLISSIDVYRAFAALNDGRETDPVPIDATSLRLPMVYGPHDYQLREEFILRRVRAGRKRIPFGAGMWLACRAYVGDVAHGARLALESTSTEGSAINLCEDRTFSMAMWSRMILEAAGSNAELVRVADEVLPEDLKPTGTMTQHIAASSKRARTLLGWTTSDPAETLQATVRWHLANPPAGSSADFSADDLALASV